MDPAAEAQTGTFDLVIVGAGINGLGIARDAAHRGLRVIVLEKDDICSGVSAWSGRLAHGGLRYLEHRDFALVRESLRERERMIELAPHLVKPLRLLMPLYAHNRRPAWLIRLGMIVYDILSFDKRTGGHEMLTTQATLRRVPGISPGGLGGQPCLPRARSNMPSGFASSWRWPQRRMARSSAPRHRWRSRSS